MTIEIKIQRLMIVSCIELGGFATKMASSYGSGIPDLLLALPGVGSCFAEVKLLTKSYDIVLISPIQTVVMRKMQQAGIRVCVVAVRNTDKNGRYDVYVSSRTDATKLDGNYLRFVKAFGQKWPIEEIIREAV